MKNRNLKKNKNLNIFGKYMNWEIFKIFLNLQFVINMGLEYLWWTKVISIISASKSRRSFKSNLNDNTIAQKWIYRFIKWRAFCCFVRHRIEFRSTNYWSQTHSMFLNKLRKFWFIRNLGNLSLLLLIFNHLWKLGYVFNFCCQIGSSFRSKKST